MPSPARFAPILVAGLLVSSPWARPLPAQELPEPGTPIRMQVRGAPDTVPGHFESLGPAGLVYTTPDGRSASLATDRLVSVDRLEVRTHTLDGAGIGVVVGALVTVIAAASQEAEPVECTWFCTGPINEPEVEFVGSFLLGGLGGGLLGAVIGSLIETETWIPVMGFEVAGGGSAGPDHVRLSWSVPVGGR